MQKIPKDDLGNRMKSYENANKQFLTKKIPMIIRIDGKAFHSFTKGFNKPFDDLLIKTMQQTAVDLCKQIQCVKIAYTQSDEISLLLTDHGTITTNAWFDKNLQKIVSVSASIATLAFNKNYNENVKNNKNNKLYKTYRNKLNTAVFDSRCFILPKEEVCNYFVWRQQDATRNSIQMLAHFNFLRNELQNLSCNKLQDKLFLEKNINFNELETYKKRGSCIVKTNYHKEEIIRSMWMVDKNIPIFSQERFYIEKFLNI